MYIDKKNASGAVDLTPYEAMKHIEKEVLQAEQRKKRVIKILLEIIQETGFVAEERIVLRDVKTGEVFR